MTEPLVPSVQSGRRRGPRAIGGRWMGTERFGAQIRTSGAGRSRSTLESRLRSQGDSWRSSARTSSVLAGNLTVHGVASGACIRAARAETGERVAAPRGPAAERYHPSYVPVGGVAPGRPRPRWSRSVELARWTRPAPATAPPVRLPVAEHHPEELPRAARLRPGSRLQSAMERRPPGLRSLAHDQ